MYWPGSSCSRAWKSRSRNSVRNLAETRGALDAERNALETSLATALRAAEATAKHEALQNFLGEIRVEQRHYTRESRLLMHNRKSLVLQERMYFRNIPLSDWIEHEIAVEEGADVQRLVQDMTIFDKGVVSINDAPARARPDWLQSEINVDSAVPRPEPCRPTRVRCSA